MTREANEIEQVVSRALRDSLEKLQRTAEELNQSVSDLVSACASTRPANALPPMLRAQTSAASLAAVLDVLSRFVTSSLQPAGPALTEQTAANAQRAVEVPAEVTVTPVEASRIEAPPLEDHKSEAAPVAAMSEEPLESAPLAEAEHGPSLPLETDIEPPLETVASFQASEVVEEIVETGTSSVVGDSYSTDVGFDISALPVQQQELHRRANRVAKVSMQDIKLLRANDVRLGQENHDLCTRLRDDLEKAHKEYDRRFQTILSHPVDYFYDWLVAILANGDPHLLGEYPYRSPVLRH